MINSDERRKSRENMIPFNIAPYIGSELKYIQEAISVNNQVSGNGVFTYRCNSWLESNCITPKAMLTTSCTHALEMAAILVGIGPDDEVILPSYTFVSTANAFVSRGAKIVFIDIRPDTMNMDEDLIEDAVTKNTKAIVPVHYAGVACEMDRILEIARNNSLYVIEDAAQAILSKYKGKPLGAIGDIGCFSFHETKNFSMGEGGAILVNNNLFADKSEIIWEKGTNRSKYLKGQVDKYTWIDQGSSYLPSELNAAYLYAQLECAESIAEDRLKNWNRYFELLKPLSEQGMIGLPSVPEGCVHNAHMFYIKVKNAEIRDNLELFLKINQIKANSHYIPLHTSPAGKRFGRFHGNDVFTTRDSERLLRLPLYYRLGEEDVEYISEKVHDFFRK